MHLFLVVNNYVSGEQLTTYRHGEALKNTHGVSEDKIAERLVDDTDGAGQKSLSYISYSEVDQDPV